LRSMLNPCEQITAWMEVYSNSSKISEINRIYK
jgi:hypothetical protein